MRLDCVSGSLFAKNLLNGAPRHGVGLWRCRVGRHSCEVRDKRVAASLEPKDRNHLLCHTHDVLDVQVAFATSSSGAGVDVLSTVVHGSLLGQPVVLLEQSQVVLRVRLSNCATNCLKY